MSFSFVNISIWINGNNVGKITFLVSQDDYSSVLLEWKNSCIITLFWFLTIFACKSKTSSYLFHTYKSFLYLNVDCYANFWFPTLSKWICQADLKPPTYIYVDVPYCQFLIPYCVQFFKVHSFLIVTRVQFSDQLSMCS